MSVFRSFNKFSPSKNKFAGRTREHRFKRLNFEILENREMFAADCGYTPEVFIPPRSGGLDAGVDIIQGADGNLLVAGYNSNNVLRYDAATGNFLDEFIPSVSRPWKLSLGPDVTGDSTPELYVLSKHYDGTADQIERYDGATGEFIDVFILPPRSFKSISYFELDSNGFVYASGYGVRFFDTMPLQAPLTVPLFPECHRQTYTSAE